VSWYYEPVDDITDERELLLHCLCGECDFDEYLDQWADVGKRFTSWSWTCPECGKEHEETIDNDKIFDDE
jgi:hypothetical protein